MIEILKTVGVEGEDGKDFQIHVDEDGDLKVFHCYREGQKFTCLGVTDSIKNIKAGILSGEIAFESEPDSLSEDIAKVAEAGTTDCGIGTWDCIHPCALLIYATLHSTPGEHIMYTLERYGWLNDEGWLDVDRAKREHERFGRLRDSANENH